MEITNVAPKELEGCPDCNLNWAFCECPVVDGRKPAAGIIMSGCGVPWVDGPDTGRRVTRKGGSTP